jgi:hypothetical protein
MPTTNTNDSTETKTFQKTTETVVQSAADSALLAVDPSLAELINSFDYSTPVASTKPECQSSFNRSFQHQDWVDGESIVQAGQTPEEVGFNGRFHQIENDLDAVKADLAKLYACLADLRKTTANCLNEIRTELRKHHVEGSTTGSTTGGVKYPKVIDTEYAYDAYVGPGDIRSQKVDLWRTEDNRIIAVPVVSTSGTAWSQAGLFKAGAILVLTAGNPEMEKQLTKGLTVAAAVRQFGDLRAEGMSFRDMVNVLSPSSEFKSSLALSKAVAEREGAALRANGRTGSTLLSSLGVDLEAGTSRNASVQNLPVLSQAIKSALVAAKISTVSKLANAPVATVAKALAAGGIESAQTEAVKLGGLANTLLGVG